MTTHFRSLTSHQLKAAIALKEQIESLEAKLTALLGRGESAPVKRVVVAPVMGAKVSKVGRKKGISAKGRAAIAAAQKARWAKLKAAAGKTASPAKAPAKKKRKLSPEGRAAIIAAAKARWAKAKAAQA